MTCDTISDSVCVARQVCIDTINRLNYDSVTVALLKDSQAFYSSSFNSLLAAVGIAVAVATLVVLILAAINFISARDPKKELNLLKIEMKSMGKDMEKIKADVSELLRNEAEKYLETAKNYLRAREFDMHFLQLQLYFLTLNKMILGELELFNLRCMREFLKIYEENKNKIQDISCDGFVGNLLSLAEICEERKKQKHLAALRVIYNEFCKIFGYESVKARLSEYLRYGTDDSEEILDLAERYLDKGSGL